MKPIFNRNSSFLSRFIIVVLISFVLILADRYFSMFIKIRMYMDTIVSPFYFILSSSRELFDDFSKVFSLRYQLKLENQILRQELLLKNSELLMLEQYKHENTCLRKLLISPLRQNEKKMIAQVVSTIHDPYNNQIVIDKGSENGIYEGQPVINDKGVVGQVISATKSTSRVLLICDFVHALPIQVLRNDIRVIANGNGCKNDLYLDQLPINTDIQVGDLLVTSGLGGRFPEGYPVAIVSSVKIDSKRAYALVQARPTASLQHLRYLLLLWNEDHTYKSNRSMTAEEVHLLANERKSLMITASKDLLSSKAQICK